MLILVYYSGSSVLNMAVSFFCLFPFLCFSRSCVLWSDHLEWLVMYHFLSCRTTEDLGWIIINGECNWFDFLWIRSSYWSASGPPSWFLIGCILQVNFCFCLDLNFQTFPIKILYYNNMMLHRFMGSLTGCLARSCNTLIYNPVAACMLRNSAFLCTAQYAVQHGISHVTSTTSAYRICSSWPWWQHSFTLVSMV